MLKAQKSTLTRLKELTNFLRVWYIDFYIKQISICFFFNLGKGYAIFNKVMCIHIMYGYKDKGTEEEGGKGSMFV